MSDRVIRRFTRGGLFDWNNSVHFPAPVASYTGPGDVQTGALAWYGFRAYSAARIGTNAVRIVRASDSAEQDFVTLATGALDVASIATFLAATSGRIVTLYDQTGNGKDVTQSNSSIRPGYTATAIGSLPGATFNDNPDSLATAAAAIAAQSQPLTLSFVAKRTASFTLGGDIRLSGDTSTSLVVGFNNVADQFHAYAGAEATATGTDSAFHVFQAMFNGASSKIKVDGAADATVNPSTGSVASDNATLNLTSQGGIFTFLEAGYWGGDQSATFAAHNSNIHTYWGF